VPLVEKASYFYSQSCFVVTPHTRRSVLIDGLMQIQINDPSVKSEEAHNGRVRDELFPNTYYLHKKLVARVKDTDSCERI